VLRLQVLTFISNINNSIIDFLQPFIEDIINSVNVDTITPPMLAHGLLTPEHCEYIFNPHVESTEKQRKLGFLIVTFSEECAQKFLQCLKNTRDYAPHDDLLKKILDGMCAYNHTLRGRG